MKPYIETKKNSRLWCVWFFKCLITWELVQMCETHAKCMWFESPDDGIPLALHINTIFSFYCYYDWAIRFPSIEHIICIKTFSIFKILPDNFFKVRARWTILDIVRVCKLAPIASVNEFLVFHKRKLKMWGFFHFRISWLWKK